MADAALFKAHAMLPMPATSPDYKLQSMGGGAVLSWLSGSAKTGHTVELMRNLLSELKLSVQSQSETLSEQGILPPWPASQSPQGQNRTRGQKVPADRT